MDINWEQISFEIIASVGEAKSLALNAIKLSKTGDAIGAKEDIDNAMKLMGKAGHAHMSVISAEAAGEKLQVPVLFIHAEDQLLTTETVILLSKELIDINLRLEEKNK